MQSIVSTPPIKGNVIEMTGQRNMEHACVHTNIMCVCQNMYMKNWGSLHMEDYK